ncbi:MAG: 30S ribosomal protein S8 [Chlamydiia bacterium]|nr:30S ribosomal protein S8 [Chlamydiia bacterium]
MNISDPVADFLTRVRNALKAEHRYVDVPWSKLKENMCVILKQCGFIESYLVKKEGSYGTVRVFLKYNHRKPVIKGLKRASKPGLRKYISANDIPYFFGGQGITILSTSKGVLSGKEAKEKNVGGELLCYVW